MAGPALKGPGAVRGLNCPSCGAAIELRGMAWTQSVACGSCASVLDAQDPNLRVLSKFDARMKVRPLIPLGTRGEWRGAQYQVIGLQQRTITVEGVSYSWREYLLFNPYRGFRYLTEYDGHWNDVVAVPGVPEVRSSLTKPVAEYDGRSYQHFQTARARTTFVLGEFPWEVRAGDTVEARDYVDPPHILSAEATPDETTWSRGEYVDGKAIWAAFKLKGSPPSATGIYANQPSPHRANARSYWLLFAAFAAILTGMMVMRGVTARDARVFEGRYTYQSPAAEQAFVTPVFELPGDQGNVVIEAEAELDNEWLYLDYALINEGTGQAWDFGRELSYYSGYDSDGRWSEGSRRDRARVGPIPGGRYYLRVEPQAGAQGAVTSQRIPYSLTVRRDVPSLVFYVIGLLVLLVPPILGAMRAGSFEVQRWAESDHPMVTTSEDDDE